MPYNFIQNGKNITLVYLCVLVISFTDKNEFSLRLQLSHFCLTFDYYNRIISIAWLEEKMSFDALGNHPPSPLDNDKPLISSHI